MSQKKVCYINVSQTPMNRQAKSVVTAFTLLLLGSLSVGFRAYLCQAQAYSIIALSIFSACLFLVHESQRKESLVEIRRGVYCSDLSQTSQIAVIPGRLSVEVVSSYERLHFSRIRIWIPLLVWLAWIAYGALFHSGRHAEHIVHELLVDLAAVGESVPELVQRFRIYLLVLCGFASLAATNLARFRTGTEFGARQRDTQGVVWAFFLLSLFLPSIESTAQALVPTKLFARTTFFFVLFVLSESLNRLVHYEHWLVNYHDSTRAILIAVQIALGRAKPMKLNKDKVSDLSTQIDSLSPSLPVESRHVNSADLLKSEIIKYNCVLQSAWLLVASESAYPFAFVQLLAVLALHIHIRKRIAAHIAEKQSGYLCVNHESTATSILPVTSRNNLDERLVPLNNDPSSDEESKCPPPPPPDSRRQSRSRTLASDAVTLPRQRTSPPPPPQPPTPEVAMSATGAVRRKSASPKMRSPTVTTTVVSPPIPLPPPRMLSESDARRLALRMLQPQTDEQATATNN